MTDPTPTRKSGRQRVPNRKYQDDAFETLKLVLSSDSEDEEILQQQLLQDDSDEFPINDLKEDQGDEDEDEDEDDGTLVEDASDGSDIKTPVEEYEDAHSYASSDPGSLDVIRPVRAKAIGRRIQRDVHVHSRGMPENPLRQDYTLSIAKLLSGEGIDDISHIVRARDRWAADPTVPYKSRLSHGVSHTEDKRQMEASVGWDWYYDQGGFESFAERQGVRHLTVDESLHYRRSSTSNQEFLIGPYGRQSKHSLAPAQVLTLDQIKTAEDHGSRPKREQHGWILNVDGDVSCLDWAPSQSGNTQYLALATAQRRNSPAQESSAFEASPGPSVIQIWTFSTSTDKDKNGGAFLHSVLYTDWGEIRQLKWCPVPRTVRTSADPGSPSPNPHIGLLALICDDGLARVIDVQLRQNEGTPTVTQAQKYNASAFASSNPTGIMCTCLTWLSATDLAVGCSNGDLTVYDICPEAKPQPWDTLDKNTAEEIAGEKRGPAPWLSMPLHATYILALSSAYPTHPSLLLSSSMDGYVRLTSLLAPKTDYVLAGRTRSPPSSLAYCDPLLAIVGAEESSETVKAWALRCFYISFACVKLPASPGPGHGVLDVGKCHSSIAAGAADGSVTVTNPMRKILGRKQVGYQQCIFRHEWRPRFMTQNGEEKTGRRSGMSRFTEGYRIEKININVRNSVRKGKEMVPISTIYEEETAVTALSWNPNVSCGGWLAVGWASGLVRVQDIAID